MTLTVFLMMRRGQGLRRLTRPWWPLDSREEQVWTWAHRQVLLWDGTVVNHKYKFHMSMSIEQEE
jgi:hypothetical protein